MDSVAFFSFWVVGVMVMLAGQVLGLAVFCVEITTYKNKFNSKNQKDPQVIYQLLLMCSCHLSVALDVFLSSLSSFNKESRGVFKVSVPELWVRVRGKETKLGTRVEKVRFEVFPERCYRGTVSHLKEERVPKNWGVVTKRIREVFN